MKMIRFVDFEKNVYTNTSYSACFLLEVGASERLDEKKHQMFLRK